MNHLYVRRDDGGRGQMSILDDTVRYGEQSMVEYTKNKDNEIMTTIQHYTGKQIEENRQRFGEEQRDRLKEG